MNFAALIRSGATVSLVSHAFVASLKGLNVFNTAFVLADKKTASDADFERVEGVVSREQQRLSLVSVCLPQFSPLVTPPSLRLYR
jgi:hypothetical protein